MRKLVFFLICGFLPALHYPLKAQKCLVHVVVVYTAEAAQQAGSDSGIVAQIRQAIVSMNEAYANSEINHWMELVRTVRINYQESGCFQQDLEAFWAGTDTSMSYCHWLRQQYHADLAALVITNDQFCGLPLSDSSVATASTAYCAVQYHCMVHNYSLSHMLSHLYGCGHAGYELDPPQQGVAFPYGHGYHWEYNEGANFYTITGLTDDVDCAGQGENDCTLINYFSNPAVSYVGVPTGDQYSNNAKVLNDEAPTIAGFLTLPRSYILNDTVTTSDFAMAIALDTLSTGTSFTGKDSATIYFKAGKRIILGPGFSVDSTVYFETLLDTTLFNCGQAGKKVMPGMERGPRSLPKPANQGHPMPGRKPKKAVSAAGTAASDPAGIAGAEG